MKRLESNFKILIAITVMLALSYSLMAQPTQQRMQAPSERSWMGQIVPGLTEDQKSQLKEVKLATLKSVQPLQDELKVNRARLNLLVKKDNPDMKEIQRLVEATAEIQVKLQMLTIESKIKSRKLLSEEQKILLDAKEDKMQKMRQIERRRQDFQGKQRMGQQRNRI
jgi:Spy/CpxP family protein refolding chaperone